MGYTKYQIALRYFPDLNPDSASRRLRRWMHSVKGLKPALKEAGYSDRQQFFSERQIAILYEFLGEP